ncbi:YciI family protein [Rhizosaccharibacter radicis]|uniref:YciI family protein n=1 Tax=Rhizosaccharibacter radicis TaxID=2782605 RepID=A0ABT1W0T0_9PROT|nr:YciI family protein [Acetobacteraceae bacterium KSS12]
MHYIVHCLDKAGMVDTRLEHYDAHKSYLASRPIDIVISGPLVQDDNATMIGSFFLVEADSRDAVVAFNANDPFRAAGIWDTVSIHPFIKRMDNRS